jgi:hypothetical protein
LKNFILTSATEEEEGGGGGNNKHTECPQSEGRANILQQDGAPPHSCNFVQRLLNVLFMNKWMHR